MTATFGTRREAELVVERLVQTFGLAREAIEVAPDGVENTVGDQASGGDLETEGPTTETRHDAPIEGRIAVTIRTGEADDADAIRKAFKEFDGEAA